MTAPANVTPPVVIVAASLAAHPLIVGARKIAPCVTLDLDHPRAQIGQLAGAKRCGNRMLE